MAGKVILGLAGSTPEETHQLPRTGIAGCHTGNHERGAGFFEYYQISRDDEDNATEEFEPGGGRESKGRVIGLNSPFGKIWSLASQTGWSVNYILRKVNYTMLVMMLADAARYTTKEPVVKINTQSQATGLFTRLQNSIRK